VIPSFLPSLPGARRYAHPGIKSPPARRSYDSEGVHTALSHTARTRHSIHIKANVPSETGAYGRKPDASNGPSRVGELGQEVSQSRARHVTQTGIRTGLDSLLRLCKESLPILSAREATFLLGTHRKVLVGGIGRRERLDKSHRNGAPMRITRAAL